MKWDHSQIFIACLLRFNYLNNSKSYEEVYVIFKASLEEQNVCTGSGWLILTGVHIKQKIFKIKYEILINVCSV
jgi:hypothetical protein